jgi:hypothetical protein
MRIRFPPSRGKLSRCLGIEWGWLVFQSDSSRLVIGRRVSVECSRHVGTGVVMRGFKKFGYTRSVLNFLISMIGIPLAVPGHFRQR